MNSNVKSYRFKRNIDMEMPACYGAIAISCLNVNKAMRSVKIIVKQKFS